MKLVANKFRWCSVPSLALAAVLFFAAAPAYADFENGITAYDSGDYVTAYNAWLPLARRGDPAAQRNIGHLYRMGLGVPQDFVVALNWYRQAAEMGLARAQANLANMYLRGQGTDTSMKKAIQWFHRAAVRGHVISQFNLGLMYEKGLGVERDMSMAMGWFHLAAKANHPRANELLAPLTARGEIPADVDSLRLDPFGEEKPKPVGQTKPIQVEPARAETAAAPVAAEPEEEEEQTPVFTASRPAPQPAPVEPAKETEVAALPQAEDEETPESTVLLGAEAVESGLVAYREKNYAAALRIWFPAARAGDAEAQFFVGGLYMDGSGVDEDVVKAHAWWRVAAEQNHTKAKEFLEVLRSIMTEDQRNKAAELSPTLVADR